MSWGANMVDLARVRFMIVDSNLHMSHIVRTLLRGFGAKSVFEARDAAEAFERLKADSVDIIIAEYQMEVLHGIEFVKLIRNSPDSRHKTVPIIMLTAHAERSKVFSARDAGANEFCCKPVVAAELFRKVAAVIDSPRPFVRTDSFFGPDRRRKPDPNYTGEERRRSDGIGAG